MKVKLLSTILLFTCHFGFSQTEKPLNGTVLFENLAVSGIEVVNVNTKKTTLSDSNGNFTILAKTKDELVFVSKIYEIKKIILEQDKINRNNFSVSLTKKPEELEEIIITKMPSIQLGTDKKHETRKLDQYALEKAASSLKVQGVYTGTIENGMDLMRIGGMILDLFQKEKEPAIKAIPEIEFKTLAATSCDQKFYVEKLKLKPEEIELFIDFCDADPTSKSLSKNTNVLAVMDFLFAKNVEFKKLPSIEKR
ncbi:hypothetical protein [Flavobacterium sp. K5-23]|uniref:hypothetical protein n=1 Tax=Flavobacterium sp. K5-23 TaxID=2746225 RepID=UPI00200DA892|nr:hypothetical protein [Flavobacterium sp. K5-23]UQD55884.1 hypothetical protein FLAK523_05515 [Flavobacterium sp. K5-23]